MVFNTFGRLESRGGARPGATRASFSVDLLRSITDQHFRRLAALLMLSDSDCRRLIKPQDLTEIERIAGGK